MKQRKASLKQQFLVNFCVEVYGLNRCDIMYNTGYRLHQNVILYDKHSTDPIRLSDCHRYVYAFADKSPKTDKTRVKFRYGNKTTYVSRGSEEATNLVRKAKQFVEKYNLGLQVEVKLVPVKQHVKHQSNYEPFEYESLKKDAMYLELVCSHTYPWQTSNVFSRHKYNCAILEKLKEYVEKYPYLRFWQILVLNNVVRFASNEELRKTGERIKDDFSVESKELFERILSSNSDN